MENETEYYPWVSSFYVFSYLLRRVGNAELREEFIGYVSGLMGSLYASTPFDVEKPEDQIYTLKQSLTLYYACTFGNADCADNSKEAFVSYRDNAVKYEFYNTVSCLLILVVVDPAEI